jgi:hypothetical protein
MKSGALESWKYRNPEDICDSLISETRRIEAGKQKHFEITLKQNRRRVKALVKNVKRNGGSK